MRKINSNETSVVKVSNQIVSGRGDFSACMLDVLFYILADIKPNERMYTVRAKDIEIITQREWQYQQFREATEALGSKMFEIELGDDLLQLWLFASVQYKTGTGSFEVELSEKAIPYLIDLRKNFTHMQLKSLLGCSSKYAKRLYMLGCQYRSMGYIPEMTIEEFKIKLGLKDPKGKKKEKYKQFNDFREKVLEPAKRQINELTDITIDYELSKRGRAYYWIKFLLNGRAIQQLEIDFNKPIEDQKIFGSIMKYGISEEYAVMISKQGAKEFEKHKTKALAKIQKGEMDVDAFAPYIVGIYQRKGYIPKKIG